MPIFPCKLRQQATNGKPQHDNNEKYFGVRAPMNHCSMENKLRY